MIKNFGKNTVARCIVSAILACCVVACSKDRVKDSPPPEQKDEIVEYGLGDAIKLLTEAETSFGADKNKLMLEAADILNQNGESEWAKVVLDDLETFYLDVNDYATRSLIYANIAIYNGDYFTAKGYLSDGRLLDSLEFLEKEKQIEILEKKASILFDIGQFSESVLERIALSELLDDHLAYTADPNLEADEVQDTQNPEGLAQSNASATEETTDTPENNTTTEEQLSSIEAQEAPLTPRQINENKIWLTVMEISIPELGELAKSARNREARGWYELGLMSKASQSNIREQLEQVNQWILHWPEHPASFNLPADLRLLTDLVENQAKHVAVLLPLTGKLETASKAIREGIMAAYFRDKDAQELVPNIRFHNTADKEISEVYDDAVLNGAELVIGPLQKNHINELALLPELPVPTLALNNIDNPLGFVPGLFQFSLAVEDEAKQAAQRAWRDGHRRALILAPGNSWGDRSVNAFKQAWEELGGELTKDYRYTGKNDYSNVVKKAFQVDKSQARAREIRSIIGPVEFEPRRREDVDMIFVVGHGYQVRQIKPTLAFHYAGTLPVYSTSHVYSGKPEPKKDRDMNAVGFSTLPWFFNQDLQEKKLLNKYASKNPQLQRLYALGVDAFRLYPRLKQLQVVEQAHYYGQTGVLKLNQLGQIERHQTWAEFIRGRAKPVVN